MALIERLIGEESPKIALHTCRSCVMEVVRGEMTQAQAEEALGLVTVEEKGEFAFVVTKVQSGVSVHDMFEVALLGEAGVAGYTAAMIRTRLQTALPPPPTP